MRRPQHDLEMLPRIYVSRPRLVRRLFQTTQCRLTAICAEAGYGKTTLATEFACSAGLRAEWCHITPADRDIARLADGLGGALRCLADGPESATPRRAARRKAGPASGEVLADVLLRQAARVGPEPALLIVDDYQNIDQEADANLLLQSLIEGSPSCLHFIVISRGELRFPLAKLRARQELSVVGADDLAFTLDETSRFLREESGLDLNEDALALVQERTEGWAAGIAMVSQSLSYGCRDKVMAVLGNPEASAWVVYDYLAEEVFDTQQPSIQSFLVKTSILGLLGAPVCNHLLDISSSQATLLTLESRGHFTIRVDSPGRMFRYHQLFREFLRQKLYQRESRETVKSLHLRAAEYYEQEEEWEECVHHYLKAGETVKAAQVIETIGQRYTLCGFFQTLEYWLQSLPEDITMTRPWLLALRGQLRQLSGKYDEAHRLLERASRHFQSSGDQDGYLWTLGEIAFVRFRSGHLQQAISNYESAVAAAKNGSVLKSWLVANQAKAYRDAGMLEASAAACKSSLEDLTAAGDDRAGAQWRSRALWHLAQTQIELGDLKAAQSSIDDAVEICGECQVGEYEESWVSATQGAVFWAGGALDSSIQALNRALSMSAQLGGYRRRLIRLWLGNSLRDLGRYPEAQQSYGWGNQAAEIEDVFLSVLTHRGDMARTTAVDLYEQYRYSESLPLRSAANVVLSAVLRECRERAQALEHVRDAVQILESHGYRLRLASALLHQARIEYELLRPTEARESLARAFELAAAGGYYHFFWWDPDLVAFLCEKALAEDVFASYASDLVVRRLGRTDAATLAPLAHDRRPEVRRRADAVLATLSRGKLDNLHDEVMVDCQDPTVRSALWHAVGDGLISLEGLATLRSARGMSWRELQVLVEYYLRPAAEPGPVATTLREECARNLNISEDTVRRHVNSIRRKLALPSSVSGTRVLDWAEKEGLLPTSDRQPLPNLNSQQNPHEPLAPTLNRQ